MKFVRYDKNPILKANKKNSFESLCVLNPAVIFNKEDKKFYMFYRCAGHDDKHVINLGLATSIDGYNFKRIYNHPILKADPNGLDAGGIEDPRVLKIGDYFYMTYASRPFPPGKYWLKNKKYYGFKPSDGPLVLNNNNTLTHLAISKDLINWKKLGRITDSHFDDRDVILFPRKINNKYVLLSRGMERCGKGYPNKNPAIYISFSDDLLAFDNYKLLMKGETWWEDLKIGASCVPVETKEGWLLIYHGVSKKDNNYRVGAVLLDLKNPTKIISRTKDFLMEPEMDYETNGYYSGCVFPTSIIPYKNKFLIYYGAGDKVIGVATINKNKFIKYLKEECHE